MNEENKAVIKALNMFGRVPKQWELLNEIERLNNIIKEVREYIDKEHKLLYLDKKGYTYTKIGKDILEILDKGE